MSIRSVLVQGHYSSGQGTEAGHCVWCDFYVAVQLVANKASSSAYGPPGALKVTCEPSTYPR